MRYAVLILAVFVAACSGPVKRPQQVDISHFLHDYMQSQAVEVLAEVE